MTSYKDYMDVQKSLRRDLGLSPKMSPAPSSDNTSKLPAIAPSLSGSSGGSRKKLKRDPPGWENVIAVYKDIATLKPIKADTGHPTTDLIVGATAQSLGTAAIYYPLLILGGAGIDYVAGSAGAAAGGATLTATGAATTPSWLLPGAVGTGLGLLFGGLFGGGKQSVSPKQNTQTTVQPTQEVAPEQRVDQGAGDLTSNPKITQTGGGSIIQNTYSDKYSYSTSNPVQTTLSYQLTNTTTTSSQVTRADQISGVDPLFLIIGAAILFLSR